MIGFLNFYISNFLFKFIFALFLIVFEGQKYIQFTTRKIESLIRPDILSCDSVKNFISSLKSIGSLSKLRRQRQRERHQIKGLMSRTIALHVRLKSWYIS